MLTEINRNTRRKSFAVTVRVVDRTKYAAVTN